MIPILFSALLLASYKTDITVQRFLGISSKFVQILKLSLIDVMKIVSCDDVIDSLVDRSAGDVVEAQTVQIMIPTIALADVSHTAFG